MSNNVLITVADDSFLVEVSCDLLQNKPLLQTLGTFPNNYNVIIVQVNNILLLL